MDPGSARLRRLSGMTREINKRLLTSPRTLCYSAANRFPARDPRPLQESAMSVDLATVKRVAHLARIAVPEADLPKLQGELNAILGFVEQLNEVNVDGVEPMTSVTPMAIKQREDIVNDGEIADAIVANAPVSEDNYFMVPKVIE
jgi:aspartyl-tRNA(Asn)/glutamyl-tRNA(Gln) amidotransferase subunit C